MIDRDVENASERFNTAAQLNDGSYSRVFLRVKFISLAPKAFDGSQEPSGICYKI